MASHLLARSLLSTVQVAIFLAAIACSQLHARAEAPAATLDAAFQVVKQAVASGEVPGAVALVARHGTIIHEEAFGLCDVQKKIAFTPRTLCWIASITKPVTAAAAMKLVEEERIKLDETVE